MARSKTTSSKIQRENSKRFKNEEKAKRLKEKKLEAPMRETVLSIEFGKGEVTGIDKLRDGLEDYFIVECESPKSTNYYPVKGNCNFRKVSSRELLEESLTILGEAIPAKSFESRKDRINYFKDAFKIQSIKEIAKMLSEISSQDALGTTETKIMDNFKETFALEISLVFGITTVEARVWIENGLSGENRSAC